MEALSYTICGDNTIHLYIKGETKIIKPDQDVHPQIFDAIKDEQWDEVVKLTNPRKDIMERSNGRFRIEHGVVFVTDEDDVEFRVPNSLGEEMLRYRDLNLSFDRLVAFALNLNKNPSYSSVRQLFSWIKKTNLVLTEDGCFIAYKGVKNNFTDLYTGTMDNSPGKVVSMPRNQVDEDPHSSCSKGLHVATYDYAHRHYGGGCNVTLVVKVNPKDVVAVPVNEEIKMRVCEYLVMEESTGEIDRATYEDTPTIEDEIEDEIECDCGEECALGFCACGKTNVPLCDYCEGCEHCCTCEDDVECDCEDCKAVELCANCGVEPCACDLVGELCDNCNIRFSGPLCAGCGRCEGCCIGC